VKREERSEVVVMVLEVKVKARNGRNVGMIRLVWFDLSDDIMYAWRLGMCLDLVKKIHKYPAAFEFYTILGG